MSCPSSQNSRNFSISSGSLPEGYCPVSWQQFVDDLSQRLIVTSPLNNSSFATGSTMPSSNVGPWFKNCESWYKFDDSTGLYIPVTKGGFDTLALISTSQTWIVPNEIYKLKIQAWGAGGGGVSESGVSPQAGAGAGAYCCTIVDVIPGQAIPIVIGTGGSGGMGMGAAVGTDGGDTTILGLTAGGGKKATAGSSSVGNGAGGTAAGGTININGGPGTPPIGALGGKGGESPMGGAGGAPSSTELTLNGITPGGGGAGGTSGGTTGNAGGGGNGLVLIEY